MLASGTTGIAKRRQEKKRKSMESDDSVANSDDTLSVSTTISEVTVDGKDDIKSDEGGDYSSMDALHIAASIISERQKQHKENISTDCSLKSLMLESCNQFAMYHPASPNILRRRSPRRNCYSGSRFSPAKRARQADCLSPTKLVESPQLKEPWCVGPHFVCLSSPQRITVPSSSPHRMSLTFAAIEGVYCYNPPEIKNTLSSKSTYYWIITICRVFLSGKKATSK